MPKSFKKSIILLPLISIMLMGKTEGKFRRNRIAEQKQFNSPGGYAGDCMDVKTFDDSLGYVDKNCGYYCGYYNGSEGSVERDSDYDPYSDYYSSYYDDSNYYYYSNDTDMYYYPNISYTYSLFEDDPNQYSDMDCSDSWACFLYYDICLGDNICLAGLQCTPGDTSCFIETACGLDSDCQDTASSCDETDLECIFNAVCSDLDIDYYCADYLNCGSDTYCAHAAVCMGAYDCQIIAQVVDYCVDIGDEICVAQLYCPAGDLLCYAYFNCLGDYQCNKDAQSCDNDVTCLQDLLCGSGDFQKQCSDWLECEEYDSSCVLDAFCQDDKKCQLMNGNMGTTQYMKSSSSRKQQLPRRDYPYDYYYGDYYYGSEGDINSGIVLYGKYFGKSSVSCDHEHLYQFYFEYVSPLFYSADYSDFSATAETMESGLGTCTYDEKGAHTSVLYEYETVGTSFSDPQYSVCGYKVTYEWSGNGPVYFEISSMNSVYLILNSLVLTYLGLAIF